MTKIRFRCNRCNEVNETGLRGGECSRCDWRAYKIDRIATHIDNARRQRLRGRHTQVVWYQHLAYITRQSLMLDKPYLEAVRAIGVNKGV